MSTKRFIDRVIPPAIFRKMDMQTRLAFYYIWMNCDAAGVYEIDKDLFEFENGFELSDEIIQHLSDYIEISGRLVLIKAFIEVNYKDPNPNYNGHKPLFRKLKQHKLNLDVGLKEAYFKPTSEEEEEEEEEREEVLIGLDTNFKIEPIEGPTFETLASSYLQKQHAYIVRPYDHRHITAIGKYLQQQLHAQNQETTPENTLIEFTTMIDRMDPWVKEKKFEMKYIDENINSIYKGSKADSGKRKTESKTLKKFSGLKTKKA